MGNDRKLLMKKNSSSCEDCSAMRSGSLQRSSNSQMDEDTAHGLQTSNRNDRLFAESRFVHDFSMIPVHASSSNSKSAYSFIPGPIQTKLMISQPVDRYEQEADRVAEQVMCDQVPQPKAMLVPNPRIFRTLPESRIPPTRDQNDEARAHGAVAHLAASPEAVRSLASRWGDRRPMAGFIGSDVIHIIEPHAGSLPSDLTLRTGSQVDSLLATRRARGLAAGNDILIGGPQVAPSIGAFASVFVHEAAHVASGASMAAAAPHFDLYEPAGGSWYEAQLARMTEREEAETGEGRQRTLDRLAAMTDPVARREAPGIAYRAQDRGDIGLAVAAADRLLNAWLASSDYPVMFTAGIGGEDAVDPLTERADTALGAGHLELGGKYLAIVMIQLVRAARNVVLRRGPTAGEDPAMQFIHEALLPLQRGEENEILQRIQRVRQLLEIRGAAVVAMGNQSEIDQFDAMAESIHAAERRAGPRIPEDLGTGGVIEAPAPSRPRGRRGRRPARAAAETPPARPEPTPQTPVSRADESIVDSTHPDLERALVFISTRPPRTYGNIRSPRYGVAGTLSGAHRLASEMFGRRSAVIVEDINARDPQTHRRQIRYLVLALTVRLDIPNPTPGQEGEIVISRGIEMLVRPAARQFFFLAVASGDWLSFALPLQSYIQGIQSSEQEVAQESTLPENERSGAIFGPINALISAGQNQEAANQLTYVGAAGFALVDAEAKARYITIMLRALTFQAHEETIVEVFRAIRDLSELRTILDRLHQEGVLHKLHTDLESAFPSLLITVGQRLGPRSLSSAQVWRLLHDLRLITPFPCIEVKADFSVRLKIDLIEDFRAAIEGLISTISSAVTGIGEIILDPGAFLEGIYKLIYFLVMVDLAGKGHPGATIYVSQVINGIARQLGAATSGLVALQENMPPGVEFVRDIQRSIEWRIIWEVVGLFVGVGEAIALVDAVRSERAAAAISDLVSGLRIISHAERAAGGIEEASEAARTVERLPAPPAATPMSTRLMPAEPPSIPPAPTPPRRGPVHGATAEGVGEAFHYEYHPAPSTSTVIESVTQSGQAGVSQLPRPSRPRPSSVQRRGRDILEIFEERQAAARGGAEADIRATEGLREVASPPGSRPMPERFDVGNFSHDYAEHLIPRSRLPRGLDTEVTIELRSGTVRLDRVDWRNGIIYEIKPNTPSQISAGQDQVRIYAEYMNRERPLGGGRTWQTRVVTYDRDAVIRLLRRIGWLE